MFLQLLLLFVITGGVFGFFFSKREKFNYVKNYLFTTFYFLFFAIVEIVIFKKELAMLLKPFTITPIVTVILLFFFGTALYFGVKRYLRKPRFIQQYNNSHMMYLQLDYRYLVAKSTEILLQEVTIMILIVLLFQAQVSLLAISFIFIISFSLIHIIYWYILMKRGHVPWSVSICFMIFPFIASLYIPTLILLVNYGFIYSYALHYLFYLIIGALFWIITE